MFKDRSKVGIIHHSFCPEKMKTEGEQHKKKLQELLEVHHFTSTSEVVRPF